jgi:hypothetical protein
MAGDELFRELRRLLAPASDRKARLFAVACCRRVWHLMTDPRHRAVVEAAELLADGLLTRADFEPVLAPVVVLWRELPPATVTQWDPWHYMTGATRHLGSPGAAADAASYTSRVLARVAGVREAPEWDAEQDKEGAVQRELIRDIVGPAPPSITLNHMWRTDTAVALARQMYESREFSAMPILADALQDAGCDNEDILAHCRDTTATHVRGCWVVDLVLEKE